MQARSLHAKLKQQPRGLALFAKTGWGLISKKSDRKRRLIPSRKSLRVLIRFLVIPMAAKDRLGERPPWNGFAALVSG
jgi:hypothetical protein